MSSIGTGLLIGRVTLGTQSHRYVVIPRDRDDIDFLWSMLPDFITEIYRLESRVAINFLKGIYEVRFYYKVTVPRFRVGRAYRAILDDKTKFVAIDIDNPVASLKKIDEQAEYYALRECKIDPNFLVNLSQTLGTGAALATRFLSTQIATYIVDADTPIIMNFIEAYSWIKEHAEYVRGLAVLPHYKLGIIILEPLKLKELKEIAYKINVSIMDFKLDYILNYILPQIEEASELESWS